MSKLDKALERLCELIDAGMEFPDACSKVALAYKVEYDALRYAYDSLFA